MAHLDVITLSLLTLIGLVICMGVGLFALKRYEGAVLLLVFSSVIILFNPANASLMPDEFETGVTSYIRAVLLSLAGAIGIVTFLQLRLQGSGREGAMFILLGLFLLLAVASAIYSIDPNITWMRSLNFVAFFCFLLGFYHWLGEERFDVALGVLFWFMAGCAVANLLSFIFPDLAWWWIAPHRFKGLWPEPNRMGSFCMVAYPICLWKYARSSGLRRWIVLGTLASLVLMHVLSGSRSSMIGAAAAVLLWLFSSRGKLKSALFLGGLALFFAAVMALIRNSSKGRKILGRRI